MKYPGSFSWEDISALQVGETELHFQLEIQKCISSKGDRSALFQVGETELYVRLG